MPEGTITLPSGDKLRTQTETLQSGALVHREEVVLAGTISDTLILPVTTAPATGTRGLPVYTIASIDDAVKAMNAALGNLVVIGGQVDDTGTTVVSENAVGAARITPQRAWHTNLRDQSGNEVGIDSAPLKVNIPGTVQVAFTPAASQNVALMNVGFPGTPLIANIPGTVNVNVLTQPAVSISGTLSLPDYARYSEQLTQTTRLTSIDTDVQAVTAAVLGTPAVKFASAQQITFSGQQPVHGTVVVSSIPAISFASPQPISTVAGTVAVSFTPATLQNVALMNMGVPGTPVRVDPTGTTTQPVSIAGTIQTASTPFSFKTAKIDVGTSGNTAIAGSIHGRRLKVYAVNAAADRRGTVSMTWLDGAFALSGTQTFVDREGLAYAVTPPAFLFAPSPGTSIQIHIPAGNTSGFRGILSYWDDDAF